MKKLLTILLLSLTLFSCRKEVNTNVEQNKKPYPTFSKTDIIPLDLSKPPRINAAGGGGTTALTITVVELNPTLVQVNWTNKGKTNYSAQRKNADGTWTTFKTCQCNWAQNTLPVAGTYTFRVVAGSTISNEFTITTTAPPVLPYKTIKIAFDGHYVQYWNAFLQNTTLAPSGLEQWKRDSIMAHINSAFASYGLTFITTGDASQTAVLTPDNEWYGDAGGVAMNGSYGTGKECFIFTDLLYYDWKYIAKATIHELGHTFGLHHLQNMSVGDNWMDYAYGILPQYFYVTTDNTPALVDQPLVIYNKIQ